MSLSTRTMQNGLNKITKTVGCSIQQGFASLPSSTGGAPFTKVGASPKVGYAHFCGDHPVEPVIPVDIEDTDTTDPNNKQEDDDSDNNDND